MSSLPEAAFDCSLHFSFCALSLLLCLFANQKPRWHPPRYQPPSLFWVTALRPLWLVAAARGEYGLDTLELLALNVLGS